MLAVKLMCMVMMIVVVVIMVVTWLMASCRCVRGELTPCFLIRVKPNQVQGCVQIQLTERILANYLKHVSIATNASWLSEEVFVRFVKHICGERSLCSLNLNAPQVSKWWMGGDGCQKRVDSQHAAHTHVTLTHTQLATHTQTYLLNPPTLSLRAFSRTISH